MKGFLRMAAITLLGGVTGYLAVDAFLNDKVFSPDLTYYAYPISLLLLVISVALTFFFISRYIKIRRLARESLSGDAEDEAEGQMYRWYSDGTLAASLLLFTGFGLLSLGILKYQPVWLVISSVVFVFISFIGSASFPSLLQVMYSYRQLPKVTDPQYGEKLLAASDDGEKQVMLEGLYKNSISMTTLLIVAVVLLLFYSFVTGSSQLFSIFVILIILVITNIQYQLSIRNKS